MKKAGNCLKNISLTSGINRRIQMTKTMKKELKKVINTILKHYDITEVGLNCLMQVLQSKFVILKRPLTKD